VPCRTLADSGYDSLFRTSLLFCYDCFDGPVSAGPFSEDFVLSFCSSGLALLTALMSNFAVEALQLPLIGCCQWHLENMSSKMNPPHRSS
jgi:hypothetical protein